jgi:hypothetical protein
MVHWKLKYESKNWILKLKMTCFDFLNVQLVSSSSLIIWMLIVYSHFLMSLRIYIYWWKDLFCKNENMTTLLFKLTRTFTTFLFMQWIFLFLDFIYCSQFLVVCFWALLWCFSNSSYETFMCSIASTRILLFLHVVLIIEKNMCMLLCLTHVSRILLILLVDLHKLL